MPSIGAILFSEILNPFYCFQVFSVILWLIDEYVTYAMSIIFMTTASMLTTLYQGPIFKVVRFLWLFPRWENPQKKYEKSGATWEIWSRRITRQKLPVTEILNGSNFYQESSSPGMWSVYPLVAVFYPPTVPYWPESALLTKVWFFFDQCVTISSWWVIMLIKQQNYEVI